MDGDGIRVGAYEKEEIPHPKEIELIRRAIAELVGVSIGFHYEVNRRGIYYELSGPSVEAQAGGRSYRAIQFLEEEGRLYWLSMVITYALKLGVPQFGQVSIVLFSGLFSGEKEALLRAEWDRLEPATEHAQPHWHVYGTREGDVHDLRNSVDLMHLAMATTWHVDGDTTESHYCEPSGEMLPRWIIGCLKYVRGQLAYVSHRRPG